ncbi:MAG: SAM-dependent methyltransferase [Chitinivibrionia bacterium]|nr:SAM-dependent methyltransferase [Chitinivibrionia bacterium]
MLSKQEHLNRKDAINLGSFYTSQIIVDLTYSLLQKNVENFAQFTVLDSSCGYGSFLSDSKIKNKKIGADIDEKAFQKAKKNSPDTIFIRCNSLECVSREKFALKASEKLVIVGNPPYNDTTSIVGKKNKDFSISLSIDRDIKTRDLGMSFLLSYNKLTADFVCVLHPLSYLIKKTNFSLLKNFTQNYKLIDCLIISSAEFCETSKTATFPILIGLYKRDLQGMDYKFIENFKFNIKDYGIFCLNDFDTIANYVQKYPNKKHLDKTYDTVAKFWTLRDINALKRNRTFIDSDTYNTVYVSRDKLPYYCYIDVFKQYADRLPFYFGNCDVIIDNEKFEPIKECFVCESVKNNTVLKEKLNFTDIPDAEVKIENYFRELFGGKICWK